LEKIDFMVTMINIQEEAVGTRILDLQRSAYAVEARLIGCGDFPPLREMLDDLRHCTDCFLVFVEKGEIVGCLSYERAGGIFTITRLVVSPRHFRRGIASALLRDLESRLSPGSVICASTADLNEPAIRAYEKQGYKTEAGPVSQGIALRRVRKQVGGGLD